MAWREGVKVMNNELFVSADICWSDNVRARMSLQFGVFFCRGQTCNIFKVQIEVLAVEGCVCRAWKL